MDATGFYVKAGYKPLGDTWPKLGGTSLAPSVRKALTAVTVVHQNMAYTL
jgi:hypothetical protein